MPHIEITTVRKGPHGWQETFAILPACAKEFSTTLQFREPFPYESKDVLVVSTEGLTKKDITALKRSLGKFHLPLKSRNINELRLQTVNPKPETGG